MGQPVRGRSAKYGAVSTWARRVTARELTARDGRGLTARGHMARELTPSDGSWAHSSSICGALLSLRVPVHCRYVFLFVTNRNT